MFCFGVKKREVHCGAEGLRYHPVNLSVNKEPWEKVRKEKRDHLRTPSITGQAAEKPEKEAKRGIWAVEDKQQVRS